MTPYDVVTQAEQPRPGTKAELVAVSRELEQLALADPPGTVVATLQDARFLTDRTRTSYARIAQGGVEVRLHARGLQTWLAPGVTGVDLDDDDPLVDHWTVLVPSPTAPAALTATDLHSTGVPDLERAFRWAVSRDPDVVAECVRLLTEA